MSRNEGKSFWNSLSRVLTAVAALITAIGGLIAIFVALPKPGSVFPTTEPPAATEPASIPISPTLTPKLVLLKTEESETNGVTFIHYSLAVKNWHQFEPELFEAAPYLPPCGLNESSSRTWIEIYDGETNDRIYGFCAFSKPEDLQSFWFAVQKGEEPPDSVYVMLNDRRDEVLYTSDPIAIR